MRTECTIGVKLERYDRDRFVKPFFYNLPYSPVIEDYSFSYHEMSNLVIDSKCFGVMFQLFYEIADAKETDIQLKVILTDVKEKHEGWIELHKKNLIGCEYEVHNLENYKGERNLENHGPAIDLKKLYNISNPEYIYLKKV